MPRTEREPRKYEMMIVVAPTVTEEGLPAVVDRVSGYVTEHDGVVANATYENPWGRRRLAYKIQDFDHAFYVLYYFTAQPRAVNQIERLLSLDDVVIRHLVVRYDPLAERAETSPFDSKPAEEPVEPAAEDATEEAATTAEPEAATETEAETEAPATVTATEDETASAEDETSETAAEDETS